MSSYLSLNNIILLYYIKHALKNFIYGDYAQEEQSLSLYIQLSYSVFWGLLSHKFAYRVEL